MIRSNVSKRPLTVGRVLALTPFALLGIAGCAQIIGLDGYGVAGGAGGGGGTTSSGGGSGGNVNQGGKSGGGGKGGSAGSSVIGTGGEAGSSLEGGASNAGAAGALQTPAVVGCDGKTPFTPNEKILRSCILRAGCSPNFDDSGPVRTISECVTKNTQAAFPGESCNLSSKSCADYEACEHIGIAHDDLCLGKATRCDASGRAINCGNYTVDQFFDCPALGGTCTTYFDTSLNNTFADCKQAIAPQTCTGLSDDQSSYCHPGTGGKPDSVYYCVNSTAYGQSCGSLATCYDTTDTTDPKAKPSASCYFNFPTCTGGDSATCSSGVAKVCSSGDLINYDCGSVGLDCAIKAGTEYCVAPGCTPTKVDTCTETCGADGVTLNLCYGGAPYAVNCTDYGFAGCSASTRKSDGLAFAACRD